MKKAAVFLLAFGAIFVLIACEAGADIFVENRLQTDVTMYQLGNFKTRVIPPVEYSFVPAGETRKLDYGVTLRRGIIGDIVVFEARDASGNVVWRKQWTFKEFLELKKVGWKICVCPEEP